LERRQLAHDPIGSPDRRERRADVAGNRDVTAGRTEDRAEQLGCRRLAVRAGHADELRVGQLPESKLDLRPDGDPTLTGSEDQRRLPRNAGRLDHDIDIVEQCEVVFVPERTVDEHGIVDPLGNGAARTCEPVDERAHQWGRMLG
jgi:hypothetical protein